MKDQNKLLKWAITLSIITIIYNFAEGIVSVFFGAKDEALTLLGFGVDSFVEVISGIGIFHMVLRVRNSKTGNQDKFEKTALTITGYSFYMLSLGLIAGAVLNLIHGSKPQLTTPGIIISSISILTMYWLMISKIKVGRLLDSSAILADASCTKTCLYLSFILLASSVLYALLHIGFIDILGSLGIAYYSFKEGRESLEKAKSGAISCGCHDDQPIK